MDSAFPTEPFRPARFVTGRHRQTLAARFLRPGRGVPFTRERVITPDDDFVDLDFPFPDALPDPRRVVLVLHGLEGSARSKYALQSYRELLARGVRPVGLNFRSCSGEPNRQPRLYHSGETGDLEWVLGWLRERFPSAQLGAVGFSLGGNVLLKHLAERGTGSPLGAAVGMSVPFDLSVGADYLERNGGVYLAYLLRRLRAKTRAKRGLLEEHIDVDRALAARTFREFDDAATAPLHGFADAEDYYRRSSSGPLIKDVRVPTLLIHARDDPFLPADALPMDGVAANDAITAAFSDRGGHVGFLGGSVWRPDFWGERQVAAFLDRTMTGVTA